MVIDQIVATIWEDTFSTDNTWENRHESFKRLKQSREDYDKLTDEEKEVVVRKVRSTLESLADSVDQWIPEGFTASKDGEMLCIRLDMPVFDVGRSVAVELQKNRYNLNRQIDKIIEDNHD